MGREDKILQSYPPRSPKALWTNPAASPLGALQMSKAKAAASAKKGSSKVDASSSEGFPILKYSEADLVRSLDMCKLYPAKVLKVGSDDQYFIHYQGWNRKWDKWVHASLLMKEGPEADKYAKDLEEQEKKRKAAREAEKRG